tara:strand:- start:400 stop:783 length:384 start_codon:yes stop_codon:yes gene_type:complete
MIKMKNIGLVMMLFMMTAFSANATTVVQGKEKAKKVKTVRFLTSAICGQCKERIEKALNYTKGVVFAKLDEESKEVTVKYKTKFLNEDEVKAVVTGLGYDAADTKRDEEAFNKLPKCCQSPGHCARD